MVAVIVAILIAAGLSIALIFRRMVVRDEKREQQLRQRHQ